MRRGNAHSESPVLADSLCDKLRQTGGFPGDQQTTLFHNGSTEALGNRRKMSPVRLSQRFLS
jgi:hypothetical protein